MVDNSALIRERLCTLILVDDGIRAVGHSDRADEAISAILAAQPDVVLLDVFLAAGSGIDVLRALRKRAPNIAVYMLTNFSDPPYRRLCKRLGASAFFDKSTEFGLVRDAIFARAGRVIH